MPSAMIHFQCKYCLIHLKVNEAFAGFTSSCPGCGEEIQAPLVSNHALELEDTGDDLEDSGIGSDLNQDLESLTELPAYPEYVDQESSFQDTKVKPAEEFQKKIEPELAVPAPKRISSSFFSWKKWLPIILCIWTGLIVTYILITKKAIETSVFEPNVQEEFGKQLETKKIDDSIPDPLPEKQSIVKEDQSQVATELVSDPSHQESPKEAAPIPELTLSPNLERPQHSMIVSKQGDSQQESQLFLERFLTSTDSPYKLARMKAHHNKPMDENITFPVYQSKELNIQWMGRQNELYEGFEVVVTQDSNVKFYTMLVGKESDYFVHRESVQDLMLGELESAIKSPTSNMEGKEYCAYVTAIVLAQQKIGLEVRTHPKNQPIAVFPITANSKVLSWLNAPPPQELSLGQCQAARIILKRDTKQNVTVDIIALDWY